MLYDHAAVLNGRQRQSFELHQKPVNVSSHPDPCTQIHARRKVSVFILCLATATRRRQSLKSFVQLRVHSEGKMLKDKDAERQEPQDELAHEHARTT